MPRPVTLAIDVYGTLIDTAGVTAALEELLGDADSAAAFAAAWRQKQLEYTFRYGLMRAYRDFRVCTRQALDYCCEAMRFDLSTAARDELMDGYLALPAFDDVTAGLELLAKAREKESRIKMFAFSNGRPDDLDKLLSAAGIDAQLDGVVSVHEVRTFKPDPAVYRHFITRAGAAAGDTWLISGNPFDICGARAAGWHALWLRRSPTTVFDPWEFAPTETAADFTEVARRFAAHA